MNLDQLFHIKETAKWKSISKASAALHITQSGLSQSISALEKELGLSLFNRSRKGVFPTTEGEIIVNKAMEVINLLQEMQIEAQKLGQWSSGKIVLSGIPGAMDVFLKTATHLKKKYPHCKIEISEKGSFNCVKDVKEEIVDAAFVAMNENMINAHVALNFLPILKGKMILCVGRNSSLATKKTISIEDLKGQKFVLYDDDYVHWFAQDFKLQFGDIDVLFTTNNANAIGQALMEESAVTIGHDYSFFDHPLVQSGDIIPIEIDQYQEPIALGWLTGNKEQSPLLKEFIQSFQENHNS